MLIAWNDKCCHEHVTSPITVNPSKSHDDELVWHPVKCAKRAVLVWRQLVREEAEGLKISASVLVISIRAYEATQDNRMEIFPETKVWRKTAKLMLWLLPSKMAGKSDKQLIFLTSRFIQSAKFKAALGPVSVNRWVLYLLQMNHMQHCNLNTRTF